MNEILFKHGDRVRHEDGREGMVERSTVERVTVQFPYSWRSSVVLKSKLTLISAVGAQTEEP